MYTSLSASIANISRTADMVDKAARGEAHAEKSGTVQGKKNVQKTSYGTDVASMDELKAILELALKGITPDANGKVTFAMLEKHREELGVAFSEAVKADLRELGVAEDIDFRLVVAPVTGEVQVISEHPHKGMVEQYLADNPHMVEQFTQIQAMSNLDRIRRFNGIPSGDIKHQIQMESLNEFFVSANNGGMGAASLLLEYADGAASMMTGLNMRV